MGGCACAEPGAIPTPRPRPTQPVRQDGPVPVEPSQRWTIGRIVGRVHRDVLEPRGFGRHGNRCTRSDALTREVRFNTQRWGTPDRKGIQALLLVGLPGLPDPLSPYRRDALWVPLQTARGIGAYTRPLSTDPPPVDLHDDVAGPGLDFVLHATGPHEFASWAEEIYDGGGNWGPFKPVLPQGTSPLQAAAFAALLAGDVPTGHRLVARVEQHERQREELARFRIELASIRSALEEQSHSPR